MEYVRLGNTGLKVSRLCLGCMTYGSSKWRTWVLDEEQALPFFKQALEAGINFFDTADVYSQGESERVTGKALKEYAKRHEVVIATKVNGPMGADPNNRGLSRKHILASVDDSTTIEELTCRLEQPVQWRGQAVRGLHLFESQDRRLLRAVSRGEFALNGLRNRDLRAQFFPGEAPTPQEKRRRSAWVSRKLRLLRAHSLLQKVSHTHRYQVTVPGRKILTAALTLTQATIAQLTSLAA